MKYWHIRGNKDHLRSSLVSMLMLDETCFNLPWIVPVLVTKLPTTFFRFTRVPSTYLDQWLALSSNFPREYTCSLTRLTNKTDYIKLYAVRGRSLILDCTVYFWLFAEKLIPIQYCSVLKFHCVFLVRVLVLTKEEILLFVFLSFQIDKLRKIRYSLTDVMLEMSIKYRQQSQQCFVTVLG